MFKYYVEDELYPHLDEIRFQKGRWLDKWKKNPMFESQANAF